MAIGYIWIKVQEARVIEEIDSRSQSLFCLRNRFLFPVICGSINHWLEVSRQGDISRARSASDISP